MDQLINELLKPTLACLQSNAAPCQGSTRAVVIAAVVLFFVATTVVFVAVKELLKEKTKAVVTLATLAVLVAATITLPAAIPFLVAFAITLIATFLPPATYRGKYWPWKVGPEVMLIAVVPAVYFAAYAVERAMSPVQPKISAILIIADPEAALITDDNRDDVVGAVNLTRNKVIGSFQTREFDLLPDDLDPYLAKAWREVRRILDNQGIPNRYAIELAIGGSISASGNKVHAALGELPPGGDAFVPIDNPLISVEGKKDQLSVMIDLLAYKIARRILELRPVVGGGIDLNKEEAVVTKFTNGMLKSLTEREIDSLPASAGAKLDDCIAFTCADEIAVSLAEWLRPQVDPRSEKRARAGLATAGKSAELLGH